MPCASFPDDYTLIPYRGKPAADGPRYKSIGNAIGVPVLQWIGESASPSRTRSSNPDVGKDEPMETTVNRLHLMHRRARDSHEAAKGDAERAKTKFFAAVDGLQQGPALPRRVPVSPNRRPGSPSWRK